MALLPSRRKALIDTLQISEIVWRSWNPKRHTLMRHALASRMSNSPFDRFFGAQDEQRDVDKSRVQYGMTMGAGPIDEDNDGGTRVVPANSKVYP